MKDIEINKIEPILTDRLILREFEKNDWVFVHRYAIRPEVYQYMPWGPNTEQETKQFIKRVMKDHEIHPRNKYEFAIVLKENNILFGACSIKINNTEDHNGEIGYCLSSDFWGKGYATEAISSLIHFGFNNLQLHRIFAGVEPENIRSIHVLERLKLRLEGHIKENKYFRDKWRDTLIYAILTKEWSST